MYDNELDDWRREQAQLRSEADYDRLETLRADRYDGDDDGAEDEEGDGDVEDSRVSGYMPDGTYDEDDDDIELGDEPEIDEREPSPDLTDDDVSEPIPAVLPSAEDLDTVASEQSIAEATSTSHPVTETPSLTPTPTPAAQPKAKKKSKSVRNVQVAAKVTSGVRYKTKWHFEIIDPATGQPVSFALVQVCPEATATTGNDYWGSDVVDERCDCGHLRSQHGDTIAKGHGRCAVASCSCSKFTWASFVTASAAQPKAKKKSKSVRKPKPVRVSKSGVKRPPAKPKKGKEGKGKKH